MENYWIIIALAVACILIFNIVKLRAKLKKEIIDYLNGKYGSIDNENISREHLEHLYNAAKLNGSNVSDSLWNDFDMDLVFNKYDQSISAIGEEYLFTSLKTLSNDTDKVKIRQNISKELSREEETLDLRIKLYEIKKHERITVRECIDIIKDIKLDSTVIHIILLLLLIFSFVLMFIKPEIGVFVCLLMACINCGFYFVRKSGVSVYEGTINSIIKWLVATENLSVKNPEDKPETKKLIDGITSYNKKFNDVKKFSFLLAPDGVVSSLIQIFMDYIKFLTHIDLIKFNISVKKLANHGEDLLKLYELTGELELAIITAGIIASKTEVCFAEIDDNASDISIVKMNHPLLTDSVNNDFITNKSILITGSNASGKSTYLRMTGINILFAETLGIAFAAGYRAPYMSINSSMEITDDIAKGDSFYLAEIKHINSIIEATENSGKSIIIMDEILRGTNTLERIAASSEILKYLSKNGTIVVAATHDVELTELLKGIYNNYYFTENADGDILFDYKIHEGISYNYNAIKILERYNYPKEIIENSQKALNKTKV